MDSPEPARVPMEPNQENAQDEIIADDKIGRNEKIDKVDQKFKPKSNHPDDYNATINNTGKKASNSNGGISKSGRLSVTETDTTEQECTAREERELLKENPNNPRITISEPEGSPCDSESSLKKATVPRGRCPIYYGIKSYIHDFYQSPDKEILKGGEFTQEDDFQWVVEPGKRRWKGCWFRTGLWVGVNLMLLGIIAMLVGHLTTPRQTVVMEQDNFTILDHWAVTFNNRLVICQLAGLAGFTCGAVIVMLALLVSNYQQDQTRGYYVMSATVVTETFAGPRMGWGCHRIPLSGSVSGIQPTFVRTY